MAAVLEHSGYGLRRMIVKFVCIGNQSQGGFGAQDIQHEKHYFLLCESH